MDGNIGEAVGGLVGAIVTVKLADVLIKSIDKKETHHKEHKHHKFKGGID